MEEDRGRDQGRISPNISSRSRPSRSWQDELNDLSGANKPIEVKLFGPDHDELRDLAEEVAEMLEKKGKGRGIKEVNSNVFEGNPDLMIELDGAVGRQAAG